MKLLVVFTSGCKKLESGRSHYIWSHQVWSSKWQHDKWKAACGPGFRFALNLSPALLKRFIKKVDGQNSHRFIYFGSGGPADGEQVAVLTCTVRTHQKPVELPCALLVLIAAWYCASNAPQGVSGESGPLPPPFPPWLSPRASFSSCFFNLSCWSCQHILAKSPILWSSLSSPAWIHQAWWQVPQMQGESSGTRFPRYHVQAVCF